MLQQRRILLHNAICNRKKEEAAKLLEEEEKESGKSAFTQSFRALLREKEEGVSHILSVLDEYPGSYVPHMLAAEYLLEKAKYRESLAHFKLAAEKCAEKNEREELLRKSVVLLSFLGEHQLAFQFAEALAQARMSLSNIAIVEVVGLLVSGRNGDPGDEREIVDAEGVIPNPASTSICPPLSSFFSKFLPVAVRRKKEQLWSREENGDLVPTENFANFLANNGIRPIRVTAGPEPAQSPRFSPPMPQLLNEDVTKWAEESGVLKKGAEKKEEDEEWTVDEENTTNSTYAPILRGLEKAEDILLILEVHRALKRKGDHKGANIFAKSLRRLYEKMEACRFKLLDFSTKISFFIPEFLNLVRMSPFNHWVFQEATSSLAAEDQDSAQTK